jgi:hypothetical protein
MLVGLAGRGENRGSKVRKLERERISGDRSANACGRETLRIGGAGDT